MKCSLFELHLHATRPRSNNNFNYSFVFSIGAKIQIRHTAGNDIYEYNSTNSTNGNIFYLLAATNCSREKPDS